MTFKLASKAKGWKAIIEAMSSMKDEAILIIKEDGVHFEVMDASGNTAMLKMIYEKQNFSQYEFKEDYEMGFRVLDIKNALSRFDKESEIKLWIDESGGWKSLRIGNDAKEFFVRHIATDLISRVKDLKVAWPVTIESTMKELVELVEDVRVISGELRFELIDGTLFVHAKSENGRGRFVFKTGIAGPIVGGYAIEYLTDMTSTLRNYVDKVAISLGEKIPIAIRFNIPETGTLNYYLAPILRNE